MSSPQPPVGLKIEGLEIVGVENDGLQRWTGADVIFDVPPLGHYAVRVVTKRAFLDEYLAGSLLSIDEVDVSDFEDHREGERSPYVLNDEVLTYDILIDTFAKRVIRPDLAASLWTVIDHSEGDE